MCVSGGLGDCGDREKKEMKAGKRIYVRKNAHGRQIRSKLGRRHENDTYSKSGVRGRKDGNREFIRSTRSLSTMFIKGIFDSKIHVDMGNKCKVGGIVQGDN